MKCGHLQNKATEVTFVPGKSGNPGGRPKAVVEVAELARKHTTTAINALAEIAGDADYPPAARVSAAEALLNRGWGRPMQILTGDDADGPLIIELRSFARIEPPPEEIK